MGTQDEHQAAVTETISVPEGLRFFARRSPCPVEPAVLFLWGLLHPIFNYWRFEHNEFVHFIQPFGRADSIPRAGSTVTKDIPDMLEYILTLGGGSLVIVREGQERARIPDIPFLGWRMKALDKMLSETRVTSVDH